MRECKTDSRPTHSVLNVSAYLNLLRKNITNVIKNESNEMGKNVGTHLEFNTKKKKKPMCALKHTYTE